jgi:hypothetical protein
MAVIMVLLVATKLNAQKWFLLNSETGKFSIEFPVEPRMMIEEPAEKNNNQKILIYNYEMKERKTSYYATVTYMNEEVKDKKAFLKEKATAMAEKWGGEQKDLLDLNIDGNFGYEIELVVFGESAMRIRIFYKEGRFYEILVATPKDRINTSDVNMFLNSFEMK